MLFSLLLALGALTAESHAYTTTVNVPGGLPAPYTVSSGTFAQVSSGGTVVVLGGGYATLTGPPAATATAVTTSAEVTAEGSVVAVVAKSGGHAFLRYGAQGTALAGGSITALVRPSFRLSPMLAHPLAYFLNPTSLMPKKLQATATAKSGGTVQATSAGTAIAESSGLAFASIFAWAEARNGGQATLAYNGAGTAHSGGTIWVGSGASATIESGGLGTFVPFVSGGLVLGGGKATISSAATITAAPLATVTAAPPLVVHSIGTLGSGTSIVAAS